MADVLNEKPEGEVDSGDVLDLTEADKAPDQVQDAPDAGEPEGDGEEIVISIGDEAAPASDSEAPEWVRDLRKRNRELERELSDLKKGSGGVPELGPKPTLETCEYDEQRFEEELENWHTRKADVERVKSEAEKAQESAQRNWQAELVTYATQKDTLGVRDFDSAEEEVLAALSPAQQAILVQGAENKALVVYALGKSPEKLRQLASVTDPIKFAFAAAKLEGQTKMVRKPATSPEGRVSGSAPLGGSSDKTLERLEKEAEKTGDRTKVIAHKRSLQRAGG